MRCLPICEQYTGKKEIGPKIERKKKKKEGQEDEIERVRWTTDKKKDWGRNRVRS